MKQKINITDSQGVTIIQAGRDVIEHKSEKVKELLPEE